MMDIKQWLKNLDLEEYVEAFADNNIDDRVLADLTSDDLKDIGVSSVGHRRLLLGAIAKLGNAAEPSPAVAQTIPPAPAERRQLTVMFCDLVGSTALSRQLDPEDLRDVMRRYQDAVAGAVTRYGGHVAKYLGDGVLAYFGWPQAYEDQAERAVRAGLEAVVAVSAVQMEDNAALEARVGIATGQVVVGDLVGESGRDVEAVSGETPNLAARLQAEAGPGQVVVGNTTQHLVGNAFELAELGARNLKGFAEPVSLWRVVAEKAAESRFEATHVGPLTNFVGREHELGLLRDRWEIAKDGEGQIVLVSGEAGIGKSRLCQSLRDHIGGAPHVRVRYQCSPFHTNSALYPSIQQLSRAAGFEGGDDAAVRLDKLESLLGETATRATSLVQLFASLLSLPVGDRYGALDLPPEEIKRRTLDAFGDQLADLSVHQPVLFLFEDAHWIDATSQELLGILVERIRALPVLLIITSRPEWRAGFSSQSHIATVQLNRLARRQGEQIVRAIAGDDITEEIVQRIVERTDGVPLFVEEVAKSMLESGLDMTQADIPATLQGSLLARLDRLGPNAKEAAQIGAAIGREFSHNLIASIFEQSEDKLGQALENLIGAELVFRNGTPPVATYTFKHALVQDAVYESLLHSRRQTLHQDIAQTFEARSPETVATEPEILAHHYTEAGLREKAVPYWLLAGRRASERLANVEAIAHLRQGERVLMELPATTEREQLELDFHLSLGPALIATKGFAAAEVGEIYGRARELSRQIGDNVSLFPANYGLWINMQQSGQLDEAKALAEESLAIAKAQSNTGYLLQGHHAMWTTQFSFSDLTSCHHHAKRGAELYDLAKHRSHAFLYGAHDPGVCALNHVAVAGWFLGYPEQAAQAAQEGKALAERLEHPFSLVLSHSYASWLYQYRREPERVLELCEATISACGKYDIAPNYRASASILAGWARASSGNAKSGIQAILDGIADWNAAGQGIRMSYFLALLAEAYRHGGQIELGLAALAQALDQAQASGELKWRSELLRLKGDLILAHDADDTNEAVSCYRQALTSARKLQAKSLELRTSTSLGRLWIDQTKSDEARDLITPIYNWFTEGFDTADLKEAKALLDELE